jgi:hypothetical protein
MNGLKLGKLPHRVDVRDLHLTQYLDTFGVAPHIPKRFGIASAFPRKGWGMLGNDEYGDCVWASPGHSHMAMALVNRGEHISFRTEDILEAYGVVTGFDPVTGSGDNGTYIRDAMKFRQKDGIIDSVGDFHKIEAYVSIEAGNWDQMRVALRVFECVEIGFEFPDSAMDQFDKGQTWQPVSGATIEGGHDVPILGMPDEDVANCITWGEKHAMSREFYEAYCDEAWAFVTKDSLNPHSNVNKAGFNLQQLMDDVEELRQQ